jgi:hypothetical protein
MKFVVIMSQNKCTDQRFILPSYKCPLVMCLGPWIRVVRCKVFMVGIEHMFQTWGHLSI